MEVIIVNDGSTDNSEDIIRQYAEHDSRIRFMFQRNQGLSVARNNGLNSASKDYVLFVDSDDWILPDTLFYYLNLAKREDVDVIIGKVNVFYENGRIGLWECDDNLHSDQPIISGEEYLNTIVQSKKFTPMVYNYFCRRSKLVESNIKFEPGLIHEDELWTPNMLLHAESVTFGVMPHYVYRHRRTGSITSSTPQFSRIKSLIKIIEMLVQTYCTMPLFSPAHKFFIMDIRLIYRTCAQIALKNGEYERRAFEEMSNLLCSEVKTDSFIQRMWNEYNSVTHPMNIG